MPSWRYALVGKDTLSEASRTVILHINQYSGV
jgi:hypothetical protein